MDKLKALFICLQTKKLTVAAAESCSGGYLSYLLTKIPGSSKIFKGSIVAYSLKVKNKFFKLSRPLLKKTKGVSAEIAETLAKGVRKMLATNIGLSIVGFAGPKGVNIGLVYVAIADKTGVISKKMIIKGTRDEVRKKASLLAIDFLYKHLN